MKKIAVLISGSGTNLKNLAEECETKLKNKCQISIVISNRKDVKGLEIAKEYGLKTLILEEKGKQISILGKNITDYNLFSSLRIAAEEEFLNFRNICFSLKNIKENNLDNCLTDSCTMLPNSSNLLFEEEIEILKHHEIEIIIANINISLVKKDFTLFIKTLFELYSLINSKNLTQHDFAKICISIFQPEYNRLDHSMELKIQNIVDFIKCIDKNPSFIKFLEREEYDINLSNILKNEGVELIFLAGFMRILSPSFTKKWPNKIVNIHPSLLPSFGGAKAVKEALKYGVKITGCTVHFVNSGVDSGNIIAQNALNIMPNETEDELHERIKLLEKELYPKVLTNLIEENI